MYPRLDNPVNQYFLRDLKGNLLPGGRMDFFDSETDTPANVFAPGDPDTPLGYQIDADAYGLLEDFQLQTNKDYIIRVYDADGVAQDQDLTGLLLDATAKPARLVVRERQKPSQPINGIEIEFTAGFGAGADVPSELRRAILVHSAHLYEFRGVVTSDMQPASIPPGYERLTAPWQRRAL